MTGEMTIKTNCLNCGKKKAIKNKIIFLPKGEVTIFTKKGCYKCKWHPDDPQPSAPPRGQRSYT